MPPSFSKNSNYLLVNYKEYLNKEGINKHLKKQTRKYLDFIFELKIYNNYLC